MMTAATAQAANAARFAGAPLASLSDDSVVLFRGAFSALLPPCCAFACESADYDSCKSKVQKGTGLHWQSLCTGLCQSKTWQLGTVAT